MFEIKKCDNDICQYKLIFEDVMLSPPSMGDCTNDTMMVSGIDGANTFPPALCGSLTGQEAYVTVKAQDGPSRLPHLRHCYGRHPHQLQLRRGPGGDDQQPKV